MALAADAPLSRVRIWDGSTPWLITGYDAVRTLFSDPRVSVASILWLSVFTGFILLSFFRPALELLADFAGIHYAPAALLLFLILGVLIILIHYSIIISKLTESNKNLIQEMALLKNEIEEDKKQ